MSALRFGILAAAWIFGLAGCNFIFQPDGGVRSNPHPCYNGNNTEWANSQLTIEMYAPKRCPFTVNSSAEWVTFGFNTRGPKSTMPDWFYDAQFAYFGLRDWQGFGRWSDTKYMRETSQGSTDLLAVFDFQATPGNGGWLGEYAWLWDSASVKANTVYGGAEGWWIVTGTTKTGIGEMLGPQTVPVGRVNSWRAKTNWDTASYDITWTLNNSVITDANGAIHSRSFPRTGVYTLRALAKRTDETVDTISKTIYAVINVGISGPGVLAPYEEGSWTVGVTGGTSPYTYRWYLNGVYAGSGTPYSKSFEPSTSHYLEAEVTDANGDTGWGALGITVTHYDGGDQQSRGKVRPPAPSTTSPPPQEHFRERATSVALPRGD